ncbi:transcriptional regulator [Nocardia flavorosea]|uniref:Transcriptional regulator n=1 Tax=Nocardia flavorosea TaxID=53429 RepID=A0A846YNV6_9NOCA|nr:transcriptional regulator [Nocardia flavorosea]NKY60795.1 transcriptional regulator [Nocardia flavorosea]
MQQHLRWLSGLGFTDQALAAEAGISQMAIRHIRIGHRNQNIVYTSRAVRIRTLTHVPTANQASFRVPALGAGRRLRALRALGHSNRDIAPLLGVGPNAVSNICNKHRIAGATWLRVADLYRDLSHVPGSSDEAAYLARLNGDAPPMAWDGIDIDHPDSSPDFGDPDAAHGVDWVRIERVVDGVDSGPLNRAEKGAAYRLAARRGYTAARVAELLQVSAEAADIGLRRARNKTLREAA